MIRSQDLRVISPLGPDAVDLVHLAEGWGISAAEAEQEPWVAVDLDRVHFAPNRAWWDLHGESTRQSQPCCPLSTLDFLCTFDGPNPSHCPLDVVIESRKPLNLVLYFASPDGRVATRCIAIQPLFEPSGRMNRLSMRECVVTGSADSPVELEGKNAGRLDLVVGGIAHDFNNLQVGILGFASLAQDLLEPGHPAGEYVAGIRRSAEQAARLTRELLCYARGSSPETEMLALNNVVEECLQTLGRQAANIAVQRSLSPDLTLSKADPVQIQQVIMNLCLNAVEAMGERGGALSVSTANRIVESAPGSADGRMGRLAPGRYVRLTVRDTGCGIDGGAVGRIFEPYFSMHRFGRGLGLAAVAGIVRGHQGAIRVESQVGVGTRFDVFLPGCEGSPAAKPREGDGLPGGSETLLVLDDEPMIRQMLVGAAKRLGYRCIEATNADEAIRLFRESQDQIDLVILDMVMPDMDGEDLFDILRSIKPDVRCALSSGYTPSVSLKRTTLRMLAEFIHKPYTLQTLAQKIRDALDRPLPRNV